MSARTWRGAFAAHLAAIFVLLLVTGWLLPPPVGTDQEIMEYVGQGVINPGCDDLNCWRILAAAIVERFPGPSLPRWRIYAAIGNSLGAAITGQLAIALGLSPQTAIVAMWISGVSAGSFATVYHPYTSDSMIFFLAPLIMLLLLRQKVGAAAIASAIGILAKEFAAVPLYVDAVAGAILGQWPRFRRSALLAAAVTLWWVAYHTSLMLFFDYRYDDNPSVDIFQGAYFWYWLKYLGPVVAAVTLFTAFGAAFLLAAAALGRAPAELKALAGGAVFPALAFMYVETPDRALFNFHFIVAPLAAMTLMSLPAAAGWVFVAAYGLVNLRVGSSWAVLPAARVPFAVSLIVACAAVFWRLRPAAIAGKSGPLAAAD